MKEIPFSAEEETLDVNKPMVTSERVCAKMDWKKNHPRPIIHTSESRCQ